ncbi:digestive cysteine proteinase 1-like [Episyrphus balteatus]|uniref:digestive cysteine proteinase 1-like n=1 Tax=Episyrphus balteatus TaxID=286459 RepID=UPI002484F036|nr:digestive cysteine proteinase 1-like [Episyrphus balteatus]
MKFTLVLLIVAAFVGCALSWSCTDASWAEYKAKFNKNYPDPAEDLRHHNIYCEKLAQINEHNAKFQKGESTFEMGVNQFTDMSAKEMTEWMG